jgi:lipopolysaccharide export system permease protein
MGLMQRHMFYRLIVYFLVTTSVAPVAALFANANRLYLMLAAGVLSVGEFALAMVSLLPAILYQVVPLSATIAITFAYFEWIGRNEIVSLRMAGMTARAVALPAIAAAFVAMIVTAVNSFYLTPLSFRTVEDIKYAATFKQPYRLIEAGYLNSVAPRLAITFRQRISDDLIRGVNIMDGRKPDAFISIFAERGRFIRSEDGGPPQAIELENGTYQRQSNQDGETQVTTFDKLMHPLLAAAPETARVRPWRGFYEEHIGRLLFPPQAIRLDPAQYRHWTAEGHKRLLSPLLCLSNVLLALGMMLRGHDGRTGRIVRFIAVALAVGTLHTLTGLGHSIIDRWPWLIPEYYLLAVIPALVGISLLAAEDAGLRSIRSRLPSRWRATVTPDPAATGPT